MKATTRLRHGSKQQHHRTGYVLVLVLILIPVILAVVGIVLDGSQLMLASRRMQNLADAAATAAAGQLRNGEELPVATAAAENSVWVLNDLPEATVAVSAPPSSGEYAGQTNYVEVIVTLEVNTHLIQLLTGEGANTVSSRAVAGFEPVTVGAAVVVLDPSPEQFSIAGLPLGLPSLPSLLGGLEVLGVGKVEFDGAVLVNTEWGGVDENGDPTGDSGGPPYAVANTPIIPLTRMYSHDLRVVGGVDDPNDYRPFDFGAEEPLKAGRLPVPDPFADLPVPTVSSDPTNVSSTSYGGKTIVALPLIGTVRLYPGVYDYITIVSGRVIFEPGVYIIRGKHPITKHSLLLTAGQVEAEGVMFYLTNTGSYSPGSGAPDASDGETEPAAPGVTTLVPSAIINIGLLGSSYSPLDSPGSPYDGMFLFQRRQDRRPIVLVQENLLGSGTVSGNIYAKWGHVILAGKGDYNVTVVSGTARIIPLLDMTISPTDPLPAATDVFLVE